MAGQLFHTASTLAKELISNPIQVNAALAALGYIERPTEGYTGPLKHWVPTEKARGVCKVVEGKTGKGKGQYWLTWDPILAKELAPLCRPALEAHVHQVLARIEASQNETRESLTALEVALQEIKSKIGGL